VIAIGGAGESFGAYLKREREARGMSLADVAQRTRVKERWLQLIEESRLDQLPAEVFVRGFVRAYARTIGGDEARAGRLLEQALVEHRGAGAGDGTERIERVAGSARRVRLIVLAIAVALAIALAAGLALTLRRRAHPVSLSAASTSAAPLRS